MDINFNMKKIRYVKLDELFNENKINLRNNTVNVFINVGVVLNRLLTPRIDNCLRASGDSRGLQLISNIINLAAHYRLYFSSRQAQSNIYMYIQHPFDADYKNSIYNIHYRNNYKFKYADNINNYIICDYIKTAIPLIKIILEYVKGVYMIEAGNIESSVLPYMLGKDTDGVNVIISNDIYDMQYCNYGYNILYPKQDRSLLITPSNVCSMMSKIYKFDMKNISYQQIPFLLSIVGNVDRSIYGIKGIGLHRASTLIQRAIDMNAIGKTTDNIDILVNIIKDKYVEQVQKNFCCIDVKSQYNDLNSKDKYAITSQLIDKFDNATLKMLNDKYFEENPLLLDAITSVPKTKPDVIF
jgi:hypothetical protein